MRKYQNEKAISAAFSNALCVVVAFYKGLSKATLGIPLFLSEYQISSHRQLTIYYGNGEKVINLQSFEREFSWRLSERANYGKIIVERIASLTETLRGSPVKTLMVMRTLSI